MAKADSSRNMMWKLGDHGGRSVGEGDVDACGAELVEAFALAMAGPGRRRV